MSLASCAPDRAPAPVEANQPAAEIATPPAPQDEPAIAARPQRSFLLGETIARAEWSMAANRDSCAPLALAADGGAGGIPRRAIFSGGWAVAFDLPGQRSAYGFAGTGRLPEDDEDFAARVD